MSYPNNGEAMNSLQTNTDPFRAESYLAKRLRDHGADLFAGDTDIVTRRERARRAIIDEGLQTVVIGRKDGKPVTYSEYFAKIYQQPLEPER